MILFCTVCKAGIPPERVKRSRKVRFCSDVCRFKERDERRAELKAKRKREARCESCGRKLPREQKGGPFPRVQTGLAAPKAVELTRDLIRNRFERIS